MGRASKVNEISIAFAASMLMADAPSKPGVIKDELRRRYECSPRTAANILAAARTQVASKQASQQAANDEGYLFAEVIPPPEKPPRSQMPKAAEVMYSAEGKLPSAKAVRRMLQAANLNLITSESAYPKDIIAATRELSRLYKLDEPDENEEDLSPVEADKLLARELTNLLGMKGAFYLPEGDADDEQ